jgi:hypothetical protein
MSEAVLLDETLLRAQELEEEATALEVRKELEKPSRRRRWWSSRCAIPTRTSRLRPMVRAWWANWKATRPHRGARVTDAMVEGIARKVRGLSGRRR